MTHAEAQIVSRIAFLAWEHREEELLEEKQKLFVDGSVTMSEAKTYEQESRQRQLDRIRSDRRWEGKLITAELTLDDLRQRCSLLEKALQAAKRDTQTEKARANGYRMVSRQRRVLLDELKRPSLAAGGVA